MCLRTHCVATDCAFAHFLPASDVFDATAPHIPDAEFFYVECCVLNAQLCKHFFNGLKLSF